MRKLAISGSLSVYWFFGFWVLGLGFLWWIAALPKNLTSVRRHTRVEVDHAILLLMSLLLSGSLAAAYASGGETSVSSVFFALNWLSFGIFAVSHGRCSRNDVGRLWIALLWIASAQGILSMAAVAIHPSPLSALALPAGLGLPDEGGFAPWITANLAYPDYFAGYTVIRSAGLMGTAAWSSGFAVVALASIVFFSRDLRSFGWGRLRLCVTSALCLVSIVLAWSRVPAALALVILTVAMIRFLVRNSPRLRTVAVTGLASSTLLLVSFPNAFSSFLDLQDSYRPGSSTTRFASYESAYDAVRDGGLTAVFMGLGSKPEVSTLSFGAGSESTVASLYVRGGILTLALFMAFMAVRTRALIAAECPSGAVVVLLVFALSLIGDVDLGTLVFAFALIPWEKLNARGDSRKPSELPLSQHV